MSKAKTERLLNLVICLLAAPRYLSREEIRRAVPGYAEAQEAFERTFERDKDELREMGVPVETGSNSAWFEDEVGYRIRRDAYALPEVSFAPDEMAVLGLAARAWQQASLAGAASSALLKLRADGVDPDEIAIAGIEPRVDAAEAAFGPLWEAVRDRRAVRFDYRRPGSGSSPRSVEPWGVVSWHGRWYLVGHDRDRGAARVFRLSRITGPVKGVGPAGAVVVPEGVDVRREVARANEVPVSGTATVRARTGAAGFLRRQATAARPDGDGWDVLEVPYADAGHLADAVCGLGAAVVVLDPPEAREAVVRRLRGVLERPTAAGEGAA
ncbi:helix-turn-helix transcriptional regulator [Vallicoccus soli]|uniref:helix-turn-helix transcriptional regulator n=1 Tax=Vallicoccus soli TaxID=2339232 RepID=UPI001402A697|nr:WYL domain-containing protein [Vallicoccus soli]